MDNAFFLLITGLEIVYKIDASYFRDAHNLRYIIAAAGIKQYNYSKYIRPILKQADELIQFIFTGRYYKDL